MAFYTLTELQQRVIRRLRMVPGGATQLYAEDVIADYLEETYETVRSHLWWDHLMMHTTRDLDGTSGMITSGIDNIREGFRDIHSVYYGSNNTSLPLLSSDQNVNRWTGTAPRVVEPLHVSLSVTGSKPFRIWPLEATTDATNKIGIRYRSDPAGIFTDPSVQVPFDGACLINGAAMRYAADDGTNPGAVMTLERAFTDRLQQLVEQHNKATILLDPRGYSYQNEWITMP